MINLLYDRISDSIIFNNLYQNDTIPSNSETFLREEATLPKILKSCNVEFTINSTNCNKNIYPIELRLYSKTWSIGVDLETCSFNNVDDRTEILVWHARQAFILELDEEKNIFNELHKKFPNNKIKFVYGAFSRPSNLPEYVEYHSIELFHWITISSIPRPAINKDKISNLNFLFLTGRFRPQRTLIYYDLMTSGYLSNSNAPFHGYTEHQRPYNELLEWAESDSNEIDQLYSDSITTPEFYKWLSNLKNSDIFYSKIQKEAFCTDLYNNVYLDIVNETFFNSLNYIWINEKTYRPIAAGCIFLICGQKGTLSLLHDRGYQTFDDLFDESYDTKTAWSDRWKIIKENIKMWNSMSIADHKAYYQKSYDKLIHNQNILYNLNFKDVLTNILLS